MFEPYVEEYPFLDPATAFRTFAAGRCAIFFDSALVDWHLGRYAFIATEPFLTLKAKDDRTFVGDQTVDADPFTALSGTLARFPQPSLPGLPPFQGGAAGYLGYDLCHHLEHLPAPPLDDMAFPDLVLGFYDAVVSFDLLEKRAWIVSSGYPEQEPRARQRRAVERARAVRGQLDRAPPATPGMAADRALSWTSNFSRRDYERAVARVIDYIWAGDIFQANLSQRFQAALPARFDPLALYLRLRTTNPAPFSGYLNLGNVIIASSSPERFLRLLGDQVETRPIKGTRARGRTPAEDEALADELRRSEKDTSENIMIVDLLRNDLSRVCRDHSVQVTDLCALESYATVHHLVSTVVGRLRPGKTAVDLLRASFPGGSITGAPKVRAMEIIAELEPTRRGPYCGAIGYIGFDGAMDTNISIRTIALSADKAVFQVGGGIVADSDPRAEYEETLAKAEALFACFDQPAA